MAARNKIGRKTNSEPLSSRRRGPDRRGGGRSRSGRVRGRRLRTLRSSSCSISDGMARRVIPRGCRLVLVAVNYWLQARLRTSWRTYPLAARQPSAAAWPSRGSTNASHAGWSGLGANGADAAVYDVPYRLADHLQGLSAGLTQTTQPSRPPDFPQPRAGSIKRRDPSRYSLPVNDPIISCVWPGRAPNSTPH